MGFIELNEKLKHREFIEFYIFGGYDPDDLMTKQKMLNVWDACACMFLSDRASEVGVEPEVMPKHNLIVEIQQLIDGYKSLRDGHAEMLATLEVNYRRGNIQIVGDEERKKEAEKSFTELLKKWNKLGVSA